MNFSFELAFKRQDNCILDCIKKQNKEKDRQAQVDRALMSTNINIIKEHISGLNLILVSNR